MPVRKKRSFKSTILKSVAPTNMGSVAKDPRGGFVPAPSNVPGPPSSPINFFDPQYLGQMAGPKATYDRAVGRLGGDVGTLASDFGYTGDYTPGKPLGATSGDPNDPGLLAQPGSFNVTGIDTSNPYSRAALLQKSYDQSQASNTVGYGSRGQGFSGAYNVAQRGAKTAFDTRSDANRRSFDDIIRQFQTGTQDRFDEFVGNRGLALGDATARQAADPAVPPAPAPPPMPVGPTTTAGQVPGFKTVGIPSGTPVFTGAKGRFFKQPAVGGGTWHIYEDGHRVLVKGSKP